MWGCYGIGVRLSVIVTHVGVLWYWGNILSGIVTHVGVLWYWGTT